MAPAISQGLAAKNRELMRIFKKRGILSVSKAALPSLDSALADVEARFLYNLPESEFINRRLFAFGGGA